MDQEIASKYGGASASGRFSPDWERQPINDRDHYLSSPIAKHLETGSSFNHDIYQTRTFNRKMKMKDTFTNIFGQYNHNSQSCFSKQKTHTHMVHNQVPGKKYDREYFRKDDSVKNYAREMALLGPHFAPQPRIGK